MKFRFIGQGEENKSITAFGILFPSGKYVEVTDGHIINKLSANSHFESIVSDQGDDLEEKDEERLELEEKAKSLGISRIGVKSNETLISEIQSVNENADNE